MQDSSAHKIFLTSITWAVRHSWHENTHSCPLFDGWFWPINSARLTWFLACDQGSLVGLCMQDYKSLCAAVTGYDSFQPG